MQTFLPYISFRRSAKTLDRLRLGKQRVECVQILLALGDEWALSAYPTWKHDGWHHHPVTRDWRGNERALRQYLRCIINEWTRRGYANNMPAPPVETYKRPVWLTQTFAQSHRELLIGKNEGYYRGKF